MDYGLESHQCDRELTARYAHLNIWPRVRKADYQDHGYESTFIDPPETPAHQFAVKALKRAVFGTPAPAADDANNPGRKLQKKQSPDLAASKIPTIVAPKEDAPPLSPSKLPGGILMTPGTANKGRKSVKFGAHVVDNEGKRGNAGRSGIPNDCPGKFPSPWTPGTELKASADSDQKPRTKLTAALMDARTTTQPRSGHKPKARDDSDITMDLGAPRSDSGKYWKEQYEEYTARSEKEVKKLIAKQQLAKNYAMKKDGEVTELVTKLEQERKRYRRRELELEQQNKEFQERLRQAMSEKLSAGIEITALKNRIETLERSLPASSKLHDEKSSTSFQIFEDSKKRAEAAQAEQEKFMDASHLSQKNRVVSIGKENSPPKPRMLRRQTLPEPPSLLQVSLSATPHLGVENGQVSTILGKSPRAALRANMPMTQSTSAQKSTELASVSTLSVRKTETNPQNIPQSPAPVAPSSPLPQPSPDPWMPDSSIAQLDKMALPIGGGGGSYSRPSRPVHHRRHGASKSISQASMPIRETHNGPVNASKHESFAGIASISEKPERVLMSSETTKRPDKSMQNLTSTTHNVEISKPPGTTPTDSKFDISRITGHHAEGSSQIKKERAPIPADRRAKAKQRVAEKQQRKALAQ